MDGSLVIMEGSLLSISLLMDGSLVNMEGSLLQIFLLLRRNVALSFLKVVYCRDFCYSNGWQPCHYITQSVVDIFGTLMDGRLFIIEVSLFSRFLLLKWMVALSLQRVVCCRDGRQSLVDIFVTSMDGILVIMEGSLLTRFLLLKWIVALSLQKVVYCCNFCYSNGWQPCQYGR